jgi:uncharacterized protein (UPF0305 family)
MIFDENGLGELQKSIFDSLSMQKIMSDGVVSENELEEQSKAVETLLAEFKEKFTTEQLQDISKLMCEYGVLLASTVFHNFKLNSFGK